MHEGERVTAAVLAMHSVVRREVMATFVFVLTTGRFRVLNIHPSHEDTPNAALTNSRTQSGVSDVSCRLSVNSL